MRKKAAPRKRRALRTLALLAGIVDVFELRKLGTPKFLLPPLIPVPATGLLIGAKDSFKTSSTIAMMGCLSHEYPWYDGSVPQRHLSIMVAAEQAILLPDRYEAWLRFAGLPVAPNMATPVKIVVPESKAYQMDEQTRRGVVQSERLDMLSKASVMKLIALCQRTADAEKLPVGIVSLETLASLVPGNLGPNETKRLVAHLNLIARELQCYTSLSCHTQRGNDREFKGLGVLGNTDVIMIADRRGKANSDMWLDVVRNKMGRDNFGIQFRGQEVTLAIRPDGTPQMGFALQPIAYYEIGSDKKDDAFTGRRKEAADKINPGERLSATDFLKRLNWYSSPTGGGAQFQALENLFPVDTGWIAVVLDAHRTHEIRHVVERKRHWFDCRTVEPAKPVPEPGPRPGEPKVVTIDGEVIH